MGSLRNTIGIALIAGSSLLTSGVSQAQTMTRQEICGAIKRCAHNGCKFLPDYVPGFEMFFKQVSLTLEEKSALDQMFCGFSDFSFFLKDWMVSDIMRDNTLTNNQKKSLILYFCIKTPIPSQLTTYKEKYVAISKEHAIWAVNKHNRQEVIDYTTEALAKSKEDLAKSKEDLAKAKKTDELFQQIQKLEELVQMLESE